MKQLNVKLHRGCQIQLNEMLLRGLNDEEAGYLLDQQESMPLVVDVFDDEQQMCWVRHLDNHIPYEWIESIIPYSICEHCQAVITLDEEETHHCEQ